MSNEPCMPRIAVIGTEGSGKTVLVVTLAARFADGGGRYFLEPMNRRTVRYTRSAFRALNGEADDGEARPPRWLPSTDPGTMQELEWVLHVDGQRRFAMRMTDAAGQDFRELFGEEAARTAGEATEPRRQLVAHVLQANIVILTVDLEDFVAERDADRRDTNEWTIKFAIDHLLGADEKKRALLVFTGKDRYAHYEKELGSWSAVAKKYLPVASRAAIEDGRVSVMAVSAVNDTQLDPSGANRYVPKRGFTSVGLEELLGWITAQAEQLPPPPDTPTPPPPPRAPPGPRRVPPWVFGAFFVGWFVWCQVLPYVGLGVWGKEPIHGRVTRKSPFPWGESTTSWEVVGERDVVALTPLGHLLALVLAAGGAWVLNDAMTEENARQT
jgi:hypothetical protein